MSLAAAPALDSATTAGDRRFLGHPIGLAYLAFTEAWERFSFYGMQALLVLYMVGQLLKPGHFGKVWGFGALRGGLEHLMGPLSDQALSSQVFGLYTALVYLTPVFGGIAGDRWLGKRGAVTLGAAIMAAGHFLMAIESAFLVALALLIVGAGLVKGNIASQVGGLYSEHDPRRDNAFQIFVLSINVGVVASPLVCGTLGEVFGWHYGFAAAGVGMLIGLIIYVAGRRHLPPDVIRRSARTDEPVRLTGKDWRAIVALLALMPILAVAFVANNQGFNVYLIWAKDYAALNIASFQMPVTWILTISSINAMIALAVVAWFWRRMTQRGVTPHEITKLAIGCVLYGVCYGAVAVVAAITQTSGGKVPVVLLALFDFIGAIGYANFLPIALALCARTAPKAVNATMIGVFYLLFVMTNLLVGWLGGLYGDMSHGAFWALHAGLCVASGVVLVVLARPLRKALG